VVTSIGRVFCWGKNDFGQLGNYTTINSSVAVEVGGVLASQTVIQVSAGEDYTCATTSDAQVACWGRNNYGQLGNNTSTNSSSPVWVYTGGFLSGKPVRNASAGSYQAAAIYSMKGLSTVTVTGSQSYIYTGSPQGPATATVTGSTGAVTYSYSGTGSTSYTPTALPPTAAGTYQVVATVAADSNYQIATSTAYAFSIGKATLTITADPQTVPYGTAVNTVTAAGSYTPTGFVNAENAAVISGSATYTTTYTDITAPGTAAVTITPVVSGLSATNYDFTVVAGAITISAAPTSVTVTGSQSYIYTGSPQGPATATVTGSTGAVTYSYSGTGSTSYTPTALPPTAAGTYQVVATVAADSNYQIATSTAYAFSIGKATPTISLGSLTQSYTGDLLTPTATTTPAGLNVTWTGAPQTNAGSYPVTAMINEQNYQGSASGTFIINQASQAALILQAGSTAIFEGSSTTLSAQGGSTVGAVTYSAQATSGLTCAISGNQLTATGSAGTCAVTATRAGDGNYLPVSSSPLAITVTLPQRQLVVSKSGSGAVYSSPSGISCGSACSAYYNKYTPVTLTAEPASGQYFVGWSGACTGMGSCQLNMTDNRSVTATFAVIPQTGFTLTVSKTGNGTISSLSPNASINCGITCQSSFTAGQLVTLFAQPDRGHTFMGWSGPAAGLCGRQTSCDVYMSSNQSVSGDFKNTYLLILPAIQLLLE
jgi:hypothetical protein